MRAHEQPASFIIAVVNLLRVLARMSGRKKLSNVRRFTILRSGKGLISSFNENNLVNFSGEKKRKIFERTKKTSHTSLVAMPSRPPAA